MGVKKSHILSVFLLLVTLLAPTPAHAFKLKTHAIVGNEALEAIDVIADDFEQVTINVPNIGDVHLNNAEVVEAVLKYPSYYRAGTLGPDAYPDLIGGQLWVHVNKGNEEGSAECASPGSDCVHGGMPYEERKFEDWRSIDNGMFILRRANEYYKNTTVPEEREKRLQALAFAYGYLTHMIGDGYAHSYVNEWVESVFSYFEGNPGALYGPPTEEIQHMAVEGYIDVHMPPVSDDDELSIETPVEFLTILYTEKIKERDGWTQEGAFGGVYFVRLLKLRKELDRLSDSEQWAEGTWGEDLADTALRINAAATTLASFGTQIGDPITDIEDYFRRREAMVDLLLEKWVILSGCTAQNTLLGSNKGPGEIVSNDACNDGTSDTNFEDDALIHDIFQDSLNEAVHYGADQQDFDYGPVAVNVEKQVRFLEKVFERGLVFRPSEDIRSIRKMKRLLQNCEEGLLDWPSCDAACTAFNQVCTEVVTKAVCLTCPTKNGKYHCGKLKWGIIPNWRRAACILQPHCFGCVNDWTETVTDPFCVATVNAAAPVCEFCSTNTVCAHLQTLESINNDIETFLVGVVRDVLDEIVEEAKREILETYAGPYVNDYIELYKEMERRGKRAKASWFVNIAFLKEDLQDDPAYMNLIFQEMLGLGGQLVSNAAELPQAIENTYNSTERVGKAALTAYIEVQSGVMYAKIWRGIIEVMYRIAREQDFNAVTDLQSSAYDWLDQFTFRGDQAQYETRLAKFVALMGALGGLSEIRGPTARMLRASMQLSDDVSDDGTGSIDLNKFHVVYNAIQLTKLGFLGKSGIHELGIMGGLSNVDSQQQFGFQDRFFDLSSSSENHEVSDICRQYPHIVCDAIQSLDDPNHYKHPMSENSYVGVGFSDHADIDAERSVASWESRDRARDTPTDTPTCILGLTNFLLAANDEIFTKLYHKIFMLPEYCDKPDLIIGSASHQPRYPSTADQIQFDVSVSNIGGGDAPASQLRIKVGGETYGQLFDVPALTAGNSATFSRSENLNIAQNYTNTYTIDENGSVPENNEDNNEQKYRYKTYDAQDLPDLIVLHIFAPPGALSGQQVGFQVWIRNVGLRPSTPVKGRLTINPIGYQKLLTIPALAEQDVFRFGFVRSFRQSGTYELTIELDTENSVQEKNEQNNSRTIQFNVIKVW